MQKWEYTQLVATYVTAGYYVVQWGNYSNEGLPNVLNRYGANGWELVNVVSHDNALYVYMKRPVQE